MPSLCVAQLFSHVGAYLEHFSRKEFFLQPFFFSKIVEKLKSSIWSNIVWNSRSTQQRAKKDRSWNESPAGILFLNAPTTGYVVGNERWKCQSDFGFRNSLSVRDQRIQRTTLFAVSRNAALSGKNHPSNHRAFISARENVVLSNGLLTFVGS